MSSTPKLRDVVASLFVEPVHGFNRAQSATIDMWLRALRGIAAGMGDDDTLSAQELGQRLDLLPRWSASIAGATAVTMRLTSATKMTGDLSLGIGVGAFQASGSFGFMRETSSESVIQAQASYEVTNTRGEISVLDLLEQGGDDFSTGATKDRLEGAIGKLAGVQEALAAAGQDAVATPAVGNDGAPGGAGEG